MNLNRTLSVMIPAFNEERTLELILSRVLERPEVGEVVAIDDGSTDATWTILSRFAERDPRVRAFRQDRNQGKGAALRRAITEVRMPFAVVQDADLEYDPRDYPTLLRPLVEGRADVVFGVRGFAGQTAFSFWFVLGNKAVTLAANLLFDCYISDLETCFKLIPTPLYRDLEIKSAGFGMEAEITGKLLRRGIRPYEVPISYKARIREAGKMLTWRDGVEALGERSTAMTPYDSLTVRRSSYHGPAARLSRRHPLMTQAESPEPGLRWMLITIL
jgi:glycosyltransferase involved in cell wall biosynthesis